MTAPRVITEELGGSRLARDAQAGRLLEWYRPRPQSETQWRAYLREVADTGRAGSWLTPLLPALQPDAQAADRVARVARDGGVVISTGQQAGLFGGPLYTLNKALSARALADLIEQQLGMPAAPVFWAATDDADFDEASSTQLAVTGGVHTLRLATRPPVGTPMSAAPLGDVAALRKELEEACGSLVDPSPLAAVIAAYTPNATIGGAYLRLLRALFAPLGISVLDASHPAVRAAGQSVLHGALDRATEIERSLESRSEALRAAGYEPQVEQVRGLSLVFSDVGGTKQRVAARAAAEARQQVPVEHLSANVLLRPLLERSIMPSAAYVAGPGEIAYFAQVSAVASELGVPVPLALPRWSATIVEPRIERLLARHGIDRTELARPDAVETRLARAAMPADLADRVRTLRRDVEADVAALELSDTEGLIPSASLQGLRRSLLHRVQRLERRYVAAIKRREHDVMRDLATLRAALYPNGARQERALNFIPFLARYGPMLVGDMGTCAAAYAAGLIGSVPASPDRASAPLAPRA
jgi:bacillithiol synthase